ncbi:hypothetical protein GCM10023264_19360 [Sphingomonas daechungensis]|uniref:hypothetical protein n=1 Tax=Sphingomonas daechungensis TaxID=1176646 RepID=UPI0031E83992
MLLLTIAVGVTAPSAASGPSGAELAAALQAAPQVAGPVSFRTDTIRSLRCRAFEEEPTEYRCRFKAWDAQGRWKRHLVIVALDKDKWVLLSLD